MISILTNSLQDTTCGELRRGQTSRPHSEQIIGIASSRSWGIHMRHGGTLPLPASELKTHTGLIIPTVTAFPVFLRGINGLVTHRAKSEAHDSTFRCEQDQIGTPSFLASTMSPQ